MNIKDISKLIVIFFGIRLFSYFFTPATPLLSQNILNTILTTVILLVSIYLISKKNERGWFIIAGEFILGGSGGYFSLFGLSLRTLLLIFSNTIFLWQKYLHQKITRSELKTEHYLFLLLIIIALLSAVNGFYRNHALESIISDLIPYFFSLYLLPLSELWQSEKFRKLGKILLITTIFGNGLLILFTQIGLSTGIFTLQDSYYHWYRDVALGKITYLNSNFYRLVLNEHLLLIPVALYFIGDIIKNKINKLNFTVLFCLLFILANNLTRIYLLALGVGMMFLFSTKNWRRWLTVSTVTLLSFISIFTLTHTLASRGQDFGLGFFGLRIQSITSPATEDSSLSRLILLPKILEKIKNNPILGQGLGDSVRVYSPVMKTDIITPHFDWGYLEILAEMGIVGFLSWFLLIFYLFYIIVISKYNYNKNILSSVLISLLILNITSPALFHPFGIILIIILFSPFGLKHSHSAEE